MIKDCKKITKSSKPLSSFSKVNSKSKDIFKKAKDKPDTTKVEVSKLNQVTIRELERQKVGMFFEHNTQLGPPYHILIDTNFINFSI